MSAPAERLAPGFYGKLPCVGDFVRRRLPDAFVDPWDRAMQRWLIAAAQREDIAASRRDAHDAAPEHWRFVLAAGVCGANAWAGSVVASGDRVGRAFPLVLAWPIAPDRADACVWFDGAQALLQRMADGEIDSVEQFDRECTSMPRDRHTDPLFAAWSSARRDAGSDDRTCLWWTSTNASAGAWMLTQGFEIPADGHAPRIARSPQLSEPGPVPVGLEGVATA